MQLRYGIRKAMKNKKGFTDQLFQVGLGLGIAVVGIALFIGIIADLKADETNASSDAAVAYTAGITGLSKITNKTGTMATVVVISIILTLLASVAAIKFFRR